MSSPNSKNKHEMTSNNTGTASTAHAGNKSSTFLPPPPKFDPSLIKPPLKSKSTKTVSASTGVSNGNAPSVSSIGPMKSLLDLDLPKAPPLPSPKKTPSTTAAASAPTVPIHFPSIVSSSSPVITTHHASESIVSSSSERLQMAPVMPSNTSEKLKLEHIPSLESAPPSANLNLNEIKNPLAKGANTEIVSSKAVGVSGNVNLPPSAKPPKSAMPLNPSKNNAPTALKSSQKYSQDASSASKEQQKTHVQNQQSRQHEIPTLPKHPRRALTSILNPTASPNHYHTLLTKTQKNIPILIQPSPLAKAVIQKNNMTMQDLMNALAGSMFADHTGMLGKLSPIRSAGRTISLKWDMMGLNFIDGFQNSNVQEDEEDPPSHSPLPSHDTKDDIRRISKNVTGAGDDNDGSDIEDRLGFCAQLWEEYDETGLDALEKQLEELFHSHTERHGEDLDLTQESKIDAGSGAGADTNATRISAINETSAAALLSHSKTPWYARFQHGINQQTSYLPHSMMHCPPVVLYISTTCKEEGISELERMANHKNLLPKEYQNGLFDPNGMRAQFLMLHDESEYRKEAFATASVTGLPASESIDFNEGKALSEMRTKFGPGSAAVVRINSNAPLDPSSKVTDGNSDRNIEEEDPVFDVFIPPSSPSSHLELSRNSHKIRGSLLSARDKLSLRRFIAQMVTMVIIPAVERRIYELNVEVTNHKKGVKNVFKSFWRKPKDNGVAGLSNSLHGLSQSLHSSSVGSHGGNSAAFRGESEVPYRFDSIESQTRLLADTLFLIRDYEGALGMYRLARDDYKHDQNLLHNASSHEMMALCVYLIDLASGYRSSREIIQYIDSALYLYTSAAEEDKSNNGANRPLIASIATRCVTRLCLLLSSNRMLCAGRDMETADSLAAASSKETPLGAAVLLEQASGHYYRAGMIRKFAFHMLMAGHMFRSAGQEYHAVRCFTSAMHIYHGGDRFWAELFNHLTSALAGQLYGMKRMQVSLQLYSKLVGTTGGGRVSVRSQQKFLDHLVAICRGHQIEALESVRLMKLAYLGQDSGEADEVRESTTSATRILEIPNMNLPKVFDSTLSVENTFAGNKTSNLEQSYTTFGEPSEGSREVWQDMMCCAQAELQVTVSGEALSVKDTITRVIQEIEEEKKKLSVAARIRNISSASDTPPIRAKLEPISVSFSVSNPLGVMVPVSSMQLVAKLRCAKTKRIFTNVEAIEISGTHTEPKKTKKWKFSGSEKMFEVAHFSRLSPLSETGGESWLSGSAEGVDPYFLVNKGKMAMDAGSKNTISLEICPLVMGELEIIGVRCKIFNEIWVYHQFKVMGELLHNTAYNRAHRVRGIPCLLRSKIECNMPSLSIDILKKTCDNEGGGVVLQGQVSKWILRVSNLGAAPSSNLCLKTNLPWINISNGDGTILDEFAATSHCIGPSGTMMRLPINGDVLHPGQTVDVPIEIRTSGGGKQEFYMLFRYELFDRSMSSRSTVSSPKIRWLQKMLRVAVYPSLTVTASLMPSFKNRNDHILSIEMTNFRSDSETKMEIAIDKVCVASKNYSIRALAEDEATSQTGTPSRNCSISWQEKMTMHYLIRPLPSRSARSCTLSESILDNTQSCNSSGYSSMIDFLSLEHAHSHFSNSLIEYTMELARLQEGKEREGQHPRSIAEIRRSAISSGQFEKGKTAGDGENHHPTSRACLCSPNQSDAEINVICSWKTKSNEDFQENNILGQHHLRHLAVRPQHKSKRCPLLLSAEFNAHMSHKFSESPLNLKMQISICNRFVESKVDFEFSLDSREDFEFTGTDCFRKSLNGGEGITFPLEAIIFKSGMYDLQCVKVIIFSSDGTETPYIFPLQWMVHINS
mmetsp:Transcript_18906/g.28738  ORF Transcript_18906/g.28738 Transcript_18906/m.28738 type:complete len:1849 (-) Transcript_18906:41-5587(-)